jgi:hypothetical protein
MKLGNRQLSVLDCLYTHDGWPGGWVWGNTSETVRILDSLVKRGLAVKWAVPQTGRARRHDGHRYNIPAAGYEALRSARSRCSMTFQEQYRALKAEHHDAVLLVRMGDFYEAFSDDAETLARVLGLSRQVRSNMVMAGFPYHMLWAYRSKLTSMGYKVAVAESVDGNMKITRITEHE